MDYHILLLAAIICLCGAIPNKYVVIREDATFFQAWRGCQFYGLQLASITSEEDNEKLGKLLQASEGCTNRTFWVAGTDIGMEGRWVWITSNELVLGFTNWYGANPDNQNIQDCMTVGQFRDGPTQWDDDSCDEVFYYICERIPPKPKYECDGDDE